MSLICQRNRFTLEIGVHYLNCAYMAPLSDAVVDAGVAGIERKVRPWEIEPRDFFAGVESVKGLFGRLVNADKDRLAVIPSVSYGLATVAQNLRVEPGQNVVIVHQQYPSNVYPWRRLADGKVSIRVVQPANTVGRGQMWNESLLDAIDDDTALVGLAPAHWTDGTRFDLERVGERAREVGAAFVVDGTQWIGAMPFDVAALQPDAVVCAGYKWLTGPYSIGLGYYGSRFDQGIPIEETWMGRLGSEDFNGLVDYQDEYRPGAARYDVGEASNFILIPMLEAALRQVLDWGPTEIGRYSRGLTNDLVAELRERGFGVEDDAWRADHFFGLRLPSDMDMGALRQRLEHGRTSVSLRGGMLRVSPHVYNDESDIQALRELLC
jgi:selenocysteine lyase/cysteine desulfurase